MSLWRELTNEIQECTRDQQVGSPVEAAGEGERPSSDPSGEYFTQEEPGHCSGMRQSTKDEVTEMYHFLNVAFRVQENRMIELDIEAQSQQGCTDLVQTQQSMH